MIHELMAHVWQSTLFSGVAWLTTLALKKNQAGVRYRVWFIASVKFLIPFSLLVSLGALMPRPVVAPAKPTAWVATAELIGRPFITLPATAVQAAISDEAANTDYFAAVIAGLWLSGFVAIAICWLARWKRIHSRLRLATPATVPGIAELAVPVMCAPGLVEPGIFGILRPVLLLPEGIEDRLERDQLDAIIAHELCHVRRRDNLTSTIHMAAQAIFWFHPLIWWLGARLVDERERACDEEVLRLGSRPKIYAAAILNVCRLYVESPLACVSGVTGSNLKIRIQVIMRNRAALRLNFARKVVLAAAGTIALAVPVIVGVVNMPGMLAQVRTATAAIPKFEAASIRPGCDGSEGGLQLKDSGGRQTKTGRSGPIASSTGRLSECGSLESLIRTAYIWYADGHFHGRSPGGPAIEGGPAWIHSDSYRIEAKAEGTPSREMVEGPMLQALLEERFQLKVRHENRELPVYALTVAKSGPKLQPFREGSCFRFPQLQAGEILPTLKPGQMPCMNMVGLRTGPNMGLKAQGDTLGEFAKLLALALDRPVIDKTGIAGRFDIHLEFTVDDSTPKFLPGADPNMQPAAPSNDPAGPSIFTAMQTQLGLKLEPTKGPVEFIVVEHADRPSAN